jgi:hypothetical protein
MVEKYFGVCNRDGKRCLGHRKYCHISGRSDFVSTNYGCEEYIPEKVVTGEGHV